MTIFPTIADFELLQIENKRLDAELKNCLDGTGPISPKRAMMERLTKAAGPKSELKSFIEIFEMLADGMHKKEIGEKIFLSERTVEAKVDKVRVGLGCKNATHLISTLLRSGVIK